MQPRQLGRFERIECLDCLVRMAPHTLRSSRAIYDLWVRGHPQDAEEMPSRSRPPSDAAYHAAAAPTNNEAAVENPRMTIIDSHIHIMNSTMAPSEP
jgi:hypothetical protein